MKHSEVKLRVAILDPDAATAEVVRGLVERARQVESVSWQVSPEDTMDGLNRDAINAVLVDIFALGVDRGTSFIESVRHGHPHVPICLLGTREQLTLFPNVPDNWKKRFDHYYWFTKDEGGLQGKRAIVSVMERMEFYLVSKAARDRLRHVRNFVSRAGTSPESEQGDRRQALNALDLAETVLDSKSDTLSARSHIVPGIGAKQLQLLIESTLDRSASALRRTANVNVGVLIVGAAMIVASFVVGIVQPSWKPAVFGGFGVAGVVTSLVTNPLRSIGDSARHLIQLRIAFIGFLNQLSVLSNLPESVSEETTLERSSQINSAVTSILESLKKHYE